MRNTALHPTIYALENSSWPLLLWVLGERVSWLQVLCIYYDVQAVIVFKRICKKNWVDWVWVSYCSRLVVPQLSCICSLYPISVLVYLMNSLEVNQHFSAGKVPIHFPSLFPYKMGEGHLHSNSILKRFVTYSHCLRWRMVMLSCIAPWLPVQTICFRESWGQIWYIFPFHGFRSPYPFPYSVWPIPRFTHNLKMQQSCYLSC